MSNQELKKWVLSMNRMGYDRREIAYAMDMKVREIARILKAM